MEYKIKRLGSRVDTVEVDARFGIYQEHVDALLSKDATLARLRIERLLHDHLDQVVRREIDRIIEAAKKAAEV